MAVKSTLPLNELSPPICLMRRFFFNQTFIPPVSAPFLLTIYSCNYMNIMPIDLILLNIPVFLFLILLKTNNCLIVFNPTAFFAPKKAKWEKNKALNLKRTI